MFQPWAQFRKTVGLETEGSGGQVFIAATQEEYDKQVKTGKLNPKQAREVKKQLKQFHCELTGFIVRQALTKVALRLLKMKKKERLNKRDQQDLLGCAEEITQVEKQLKGTLKDEREELSHFWRRAVVETWADQTRQLVLTTRFRPGPTGEADVRLGADGGFGGWYCVV